MTSVALLHRVVDVLHVHEDRDSIHGVPCLEHISDESAHIWQFEL
jgi:hypothetical protein